MDSLKEYIMCAAVHYMDDKEHVHQPINVTSGYVVCGHRHHNIHPLVHYLLGSRPNQDGILCTYISGFLTSKNRFVDRIEGRDIANKSGQCDKKEGILFSEDVW